MASSRTSIEEFARLTGRRVLGNKAASGTEIIDELGAEHMRTGALIVYTSADSVFQIAAHEDVVPVPELYRRLRDRLSSWSCEGLGCRARDRAAVRRRTPERFKRTATATTTRCRRRARRCSTASRPHGVPVVAIGKIEDLFAGRGITRAIHTASDDEGMDDVERQIGSVSRAGSSSPTSSTSTRSTATATTSSGYARNLERFDGRLAELLPRLRADDLLVVTADHGNDPTTPSTDHSREYVPLLVAGARVRARRRPRHATHVRRPRADARRDLRRRSARARHELPPGDRRVDQVERLRGEPARAARGARARDSRAAGAKSADSRGRLRPEAEDDVRPAFQRDRDRIIHCKAFRRLKHKTQVFFAPTGDHYRTRLTHTLEVSQIARTIAKVLRLHEELTEAIALGHDLGHTPFGHAGERVIDRSDARRLQPLRAEPAHRRPARERRPRPEPDVGSPRRHREALEGEVGRAGRHAAGAAREHARRADHARRRSHRLRQPRHRRCDAGGAAAGRAICRGSPFAALGDSSSARIGTLVKDVVTETLAGGLTEIRMSEPRARRRARSAELSLRRGLRERDRDRRVQEGDRHPERPLGEGARAARRVSRSPDGPERRASTPPTRDFLAGMTDRYAVRLFEQLFIPKPWAIDVMAELRSGSSSRSFASVRAMQLKVPHGILGGSCCC